MRERPVIGRRSLVLSPTRFSDDVYDDRDWLSETRDATRPERMGERMGSTLER